MLDLGMEGVVLVDGRRREAQSGCWVGVGGAVGRGSGIVRRKRRRRRRRGRGDCSEIGRGCRIRLMRRAYLIVLCPGVVQ